MKAIIYSRPTCAPCHAVKRFLASKGIEYIEFDADDPEIAKQAQKLSGVVTVPITVINGKVLVGFNLSKLADAIGQGV